jgi:tyrosyl-tRNA synthetase
VHGEGERDAAEAAGRALFGQGDLGDLPPATLAAALAEAPHVVIEAAEVVDGLLPAYDELLLRTGLSVSKSAARRTIDEGGAYVNNERVSDAAAQPSRSDLHHGEWLVLRRGKKAFAGVRVEQP